jgi:hypothetical protein
MLICATLPWYRVDDQVSFTGTDSSGGLAPVIGVVVLAGVLLMLTLRRRGQQVTAVVIGGVALVSGIALQFSSPGSDEVFAEIRRHSLADSYQLHWTGGSLGYGLAALAVVAGAALTVLRAARWPSRSQRFDRRPPDAGYADPAQDPSAFWKAMDAGEDPTVGPEDRPDR